MGHCGSTEYLTPESASWVLYNAGVEKDKPDTKNGREADFWSFGVILYFLFGDIDFHENAGLSYFPFGDMGHILKNSQLPDRDARVQIAKAIREKELNIDEAMGEGTPPEVRDLIAGLLQKDRTARLKFIGPLVNGRYDNLRNMAWFNKFDWDLLDSGDYNDYPDNWRKVCQMTKDYKAINVYRSLLKPIQIEKECILKKGDKVVPVKVDKDAIHVKLCLSTFSVSDFVVKI